VVLSVEEHVFLVEYVFREGNRYTDLVQEQFAEKFPETAMQLVDLLRNFVKQT
jgi:HEPN domain-containing protein